MREVIEEITLGKVRASGIREDSELIDELGLDSLDYGSTLLQCEQWLGIKIREDGVNWREIRTAGQLSAFLHAHQQPGK
jgi:acyl carrier protein